ncbi:hypothetical protein ACFYPH_29295 [Micromonospora sp. NPDC005252]|uniref:hypothetical protein n=2 Tax=unclassified Micromonospora TaxID=2617518 RepID=UPI0036BD63AD
MNPYRPDRHAGRAETERLLDATRIDAAVYPEASLRAGTSADFDAAVDSDAALHVDTAVDSDAALHVDAALDLDAGERSRAPAASQAAADPLARLLAAAAGPARPGELAGEEAALAAFRAARAAAPEPAAARRPRSRRLTTSALAWIGALAATATAGAAFAAAGLDRAPDPVPPAPSSAPPTASDPAATAATTPTAPSRSASPGPPSPTGTPTVGSAPNGQLHGLCRAWRAGKPEKREKKLRTPAFQRLVEAAGGVAAVEEYCQRLVPEAKPSAPARSSAPAEPSSAGTPPGSAKTKPSHPAGSAAN